MHYVSIHAALKSGPLARSIHVVLGLVALSLIWPGSFAAALDANPCDIPSLLELGGVLSPPIGSVDFSLDTLDFDVVAVDVNSTGWIHLEATAYGWDSRGETAWLESTGEDSQVTGAPCSAGYTVVQRHFDQVLLWIGRPGRIFLNVGLLGNEAEWRSELRLTARSLGHPRHTQAGFGPGDLRKNDPGDDTASEEDDILQLTAPESCGCLSILGIAGPRKNDPGDDTASEEDDILPLVDPGHSEGDPVEAECVISASDPRKSDPGDDTASEEDDILPLTSESCGCASEPANDLPSCAVELGSATWVRAELSSAAIGIPDRDHYSFSLKRSGRVEITVTGAQVRGVLMDSRGRRLGASETAGDGFQLDAFLPSGRYLVRIESAEPWSSGEYRLHVKQ